MRRYSHRIPTYRKLVQRLVRTSIFPVTCSNYEAARARIVLYTCTGGSTFDQVIHPKALAKAYLYAAWRQEFSLFSVECA